MAQLAIKGHPTRGREVIQLLEMLGGENVFETCGKDDMTHYFINEDTNYIIGEVYLDKHANFITFTLEEFEENFPYKVGDIVQSRNTPNHEMYTIKSMEWDSYIKQICYTIKKTDGVVSLFKWTAQELMPHKSQKTMEENLTIQDIRDNNAAWLLNKLQEMSSKKAMQTINDLYDELHKPQYPKDYEECCKILNIPFNGNIVYAGQWVYGGKYLEKYLDVLRKFQQLLICRDAYWKIYGEQMGLGKPWDPDWGSLSTTRAHIRIDKSRFVVYLSSILVFPTEKMRDVFRKNFKELIEQCKELL